MAKERSQIESTPLSCVRNQLIDVFILVSRELDNYLMQMSWYLLPMLQKHKLINEKETDFLAGR